MKKITITNFEDALNKRAMFAGDSEMVIVGDNMEVSDGDHTFAELYEHRHILFLALARTSAFDDELCQYPVWCSTLHADGSSYDDWFIMGIGDKAGEQISYHLPARYWSDACSFAQVLDRAPEWDGHTSKDVLERIKNLYICPKKK